MRAALILTSVLMSTHLSALGFEAPRAMATGGSSFLMQNLGLMCFGFDLAADTLPCNPSFIAMKREGRLKASIFLGNNVSYTQEASDLLNERASEETIRHLFSEQDRSEFETNLEAGYWGQTWGAAISPVRLNYMTTFRNPALPEITLFASQEESARLQFGTYLGNDLFTGVQLRAVHRKFISKQFFLTDALANDGDRFFETDNQSILYIEPGLLYAPENHKWNPLLFFNIVNFGLVDKTQDAFPMRPQYHIGSSVALDVGLGRWGVGIDLAWDNNVTSALEPLTAASFYEFGILRLLGHISERSNSVGFQVSSVFFNIGLASQAKTVDDGWDNKITDRRLYLLLGAEI